MPVETPSLFAQVIKDHLDLKERNSDLDRQMPIDRYRSDDPFENHPLFKTEEQARLEETMDGIDPDFVAHSATVEFCPGPAKRLRIMHRARPQARSRIPVFGKPIAPATSTGATRLRCGGTASAGALAARYRRPVATSRRSVDEGCPSPAFAASVLVRGGLRSGGSSPSRARRAPVSSQRPALLRDAELLAEERLRRGRAEKTSTAGRHDARAPPRAMAGTPSAPTRASPWIGVAAPLAARVPLEVLRRRSCT